MCSNCAEFTLLCGALEGPDDEGRPSLGGIEQALTQASIMRRPFVFSSRAPVECQPASWRCSG
eukprot:9442090-Alexandrium_andersonii.AAC.1